MLIVDGSVAVLWYVPQALSPEATALVSSGESLAAPRLVQLEVASVLLRSIRRGDLSEAEADEVLADMLPKTLRLLDEPELARDAVRIAARHGGALYDAVYIAAAARLAAGLVTADAGQARVAALVGIRTRLLTVRAEG